MPRRSSKDDPLFLRAEQLADDFSLFPQRGDPSERINGLLSRTTIQKELHELKDLDVDAYIERTVLPCEAKSRLDAKTVIKRLRGKTLSQGDEGPLYWAEMELEHEGAIRRVGIIAQNRAANNGVWMPEHHERAIEVVRGFAQYSLPIVTFMDTPGADAGAEANAQNQAHSISHLIAEMAQIDVPSLGIILGAGYSGGAIPLATTNLLLSVRDGVFNTIQPQGLASIARKYDLSWQECAKYVGVSSYELYEQGHIDGIIDYVPGDRARIGNLRKAIVSGILLIEQTALGFVRRNPVVFQHYRRSIDRYVSPATELQWLQDSSNLSRAETPTCQLNIFGVAYRYMRYLSMRGRISASSISSYGRLSKLEIPKGDLHRRAEEERSRVFSKWLENPLELKYDDGLLKTWKTFRSRAEARDDEPNRLSRWVFGEPGRKYEQSLSRLCTDCAFYLYNLWKADAAGSLFLLAEYLDKAEDTPVPDSEADITVLHVLRSPEVRTRFVAECQNLLIFDAIYNNIVHNLASIAQEAKETNTISEDSVRKLIEPALSRAAVAVSKQSQEAEIAEEAMGEQLETQFRAWMDTLSSYPDRGTALKATEEWKKRMFPRLSEPVFAIITFIIEQLLPRYYAPRDDKGFDGRITPRNIGMKDFWNRLTIAYHDLLIQELLTNYKKKDPISTDRVIERFFSTFRELQPGLMTADPVRFPGFRISIESALAKDVKPCGLITGIGRFKDAPGRPRMGVAVSNLAFQAGAFDMASAEKFCRLLLTCMQQHVPVVCFISSGGMQTKEGAGSLFSMPIVNDRITRFVRDTNLPIICFGFGDCTGGAQASLVTHPLVQTYYFSGTNMPFAGQIVVPSYLPSTATLSNYLSTTEGAMNGLVKNPFRDDIDEKLAEIDPEMPVPAQEVGDVVGQVLNLEDIEPNDLELEADDDLALATDEEHTITRPVRRVLIHARGCSAVKLVRKAREHGISVVLVQSDADIDSIAAGLLGDRDELVCIGGNTPDESYLNAHSVIRVAEREDVDAVHPGIGFLSENSQFAQLCRRHDLNFIGPPVRSMTLMGNKSNAINTAIDLDVSTVPGSRGVVTTVAAAKRLAAQDIGFPVLIKAVHGGGGKGIQVVRDSESFADLFAQIKAEARSAFGSSDVYLEKFIESMRHTEVQVLRDSHGNTKILGLRDCSVQRNNQKIIEESGSTMLPGNLEQDVYRYAAAIADRVGYLGAGTVEFIYDIPSNAVYFMEMNTRLQVEHPVTEAVTGIDIVKAQFDIASGKSIANMDFKPNGYAIEVRINAESAVLEDDGTIGFKPSPGRITKYRMPDAEGFEIISCIGEDREIPPFYDNMVVQLIAHGRDRADTIERMLTYLGNVEIRGVATNIPLLKRILKDEVFRAGEYDTRYLNGLLERIDGEALVADCEATAESQNKIMDVDALRIEGSDELKVLAAFSGVFYRTPSPSDPEFVAVGDDVDVETKLCLMEAMKLFTPLSLRAFNNGETEVYPADTNYEIVRIVPENAQAVSAGDLLFVIKPK